MNTLLAQFFCNLEFEILYLQSTNSMQIYWPCQTSSAVNFVTKLVVFWNYQINFVWPGIKYNANFMKGQFTITFKGCLGLDYP
jgi:hypothetical protein